MPFKSQAQKEDERIVHGGKCPPGQIFDHKKSSPTFGRCISVLAYKEREAMNGLKQMKDNVGKV